MKNKVKYGIEKLNIANKTFGSNQIPESFIKFINDETKLVDLWIYTFDPKNPDNLGNVIYTRDQKTTELQEVLIQHIKNTQ